MQAFSVAMLQEYMELNRNDSFNCVNQLADVINQLILGHPDPSDAPVIIRKINESRSTPIWGVYRFSKDMLYVAAGYPVMAEDHNIRSGFANTLSYCMGIGEYEESLRKKKPPVWIPKIGSFMFTTKNYTDVYCSSGVWVTITFNAPMNRVEITER